MFLPRNPFAIPRSFAIATAIALILAPATGCRRAPQTPVTITFLDPEWSSDMAKNRTNLMPATLQEFTQQTGIQVKHLPAPEGEQDQLELIRQLLQQGSAGPDVYGIDLIWPGALHQNLIDLKPYFSAELKSDDQELVTHYTIQNRLVAVPYHTNVGVLLYRADLLQKYGFPTPPKTWD